MGRSKVILGMSGGVDSSVAASLLVEQGYDVHGVTLQVWDEEDESVAASKQWQERGCCKVGLAKHVAKLVGIPHTVIDSRETFRKNVIQDFVSGYVSGTTPNPCVRCNERVKFGSLYQIARDMGAEFVATGHYANIRQDRSGRYSLMRASDQRKDQSYFLYRLAHSWLPHLLFPLGGLQKTEVWRHAEDMGLPTDELKESQEICFVTQGDYREFLKTEAPEAHRPGPFLDVRGTRLGEHEGIAFYTPGQRKGLGLALGERLYVQQVFPETNTVVVGSQDDLLNAECHVGELNVLDEQQLLDGSPVEVKFRYASAPTPATARLETGGVMHIRFASPQRALSPGQSAVFYRGEQVLGGGIIQRWSRNFNKKYPASNTSVCPPSRDEIVQCS